MSVEIKEISRFVAEQMPFSQLPEAATGYFARHLEVVYVTRENQHQWLDSSKPCLFLVRTGHYDLVAPDGELVTRLGEGDYFGYPSLLTGEPVRNRLEVQREGLIYVLAEADFDFLRREYKPFEQHFVRAHANRLLSSQYRNRGENWSERKISELMARQAVTLSPDASIRQCAVVMNEHGVSSIIVTENERLAGVVTDRDLRNRVLAADLPPGEPISRIMTANPKYIFDNNRVFSALHLMLKHNIHHLPVLDENHKPVGMLTSTDLLRQQKSDPVQLIGRIYKAVNAADLRRLAKEVPDLLHGFSRKVEDISLIGKLLSGITDALTSRLIALYQEEFGDAPAPFCWICFGSQAREEQTLHSDQDNGLVLADGLSESERAYFAAMGEYVCGQLAECGIAPCPGNIMASNEQCRGGVSEWLAKFADWVEKPTPEALLSAKIFFDIRFIDGSSDLYRAFSERLAGLNKNQLFFAALGADLQRSSVPIGLFNQFKLETDDKHHKFLDLKKRGVAIINDIVRLYALSSGLRKANTLERLDGLTKTRELSKSDIYDLKDCWRFLTQLRLRGQMQSEELPANSINPHALTSLERHQLKEAFFLVRQAQQAALFKFGRGSL